jgi:hypothetical protein
MLAVLLVLQYIAFCRHTVVVPTSWFVQYYVLFLVNSFNQWHNFGETGWCNPYALCCPNGMQSDYKDSVAVQCWHQSSRWRMFSLRIVLFWFLFLWVNCFNLFNSQYGWTPLHLAVQAQRTDIVRLLLLKGADRTLKTQVSILLISSIPQMIQWEHIMPCWVLINSFHITYLFLQRCHVTSSVLFMIHL